MLTPNEIEYEETELIFNRPVTNPEILFLRKIQKKVRLNRVKLLFNPT